jgi:hypothetical protein
MRQEPRLSSGNQESAAVALGYVLRAFFANYAALGNVGWWRIRRWATVYHMPHAAAKNKSRLCCLELLETD